MIFFFSKLLLSNYPIASTVFCTCVKCAIRTSTRKQLTLGDPYASVVVLCGMFTAYFDPVSVHATNDIPSRDPSVNYQSRQQISPRPPVRPRTCLYSSFLLFFLQLDKA